MVRIVAWRIRFLLPWDCASAIEGRSRVAAEPVMAQGNMTVGKAIPENTPYRDSACAELRPLSTSLTGSWIASIVANRLRQILLRLSGHAICSSSLHFDKDNRETSLISQLRMECRYSMKLEKTAEAHSPANSPIMAIARGKG